MSRVYIIGDSHGMTDKYYRSGTRRQKLPYVELVKNCDYSIQVGDMAFNYEHVKKVDPARHVFIGGNHDNYDAITECPQYLGDFGYHKLGDFSFFFVRGAYSIDKQGRLYNEFKGGLKTWWKEEELTYGRGMAALQAYAEIKPDVMITHSCPSNISEMVGSPGVLPAFGLPANWESSTQKMLQAMYEVHQPKYWFFGHFHKNWQKAVGMTLFTCIDELSYVIWDNNQIESLEDGWL